MTNIKYHPPTDHIYQCKKCSVIAQEPEPSNRPCPICEKQMTLINQPAPVPEILKKLEQLQAKANRRKQPISKHYPRKKNQSCGISDILKLQQFHKSIVNQNNPDQVA